MHNENIGDDEYHDDDEHDEEYLSLEQETIGKSKGWGQFVGLVLMFITTPFAFHYAIIGVAVLTFFPFIWCAISIKEYKQHVLIGTGRPDAKLTFMYFILMGIPLGLLLSPFIMFLGVILRLQYLS